MASLHRSAMQAPAKSKVHRHFLAPQACGFSSICTSLSPMSEDKVPGLQETFISHLVELRTRLVRASAVVLAVFIILFAIWPGAAAIYDFLAQPMMSALPEGSKMIATGVITPFMKKILQEHEHTQGVDLRKKNAKEVVEHIMQRKRIFLSYYLKIVCMRLEGEIMLHEAATAADDASSP